MLNPHEPRPDEQVGDSPSSPVNPYAPAGWVNESQDEGLSEVVRIRRTHINQETSIRAIGGLFCLMALPFLLGIFGAFVAYWDRQQFSMGEIGTTILLMVAIGVTLITIGIGLRRRSPTAKTFGIVLSGLSLLAFPIGTVLGGYVLYMLASKKAEVIFSSDYQDVIDQTPEVRCRTSAGGLAVVLVLIFAVIAAILVS